MIRVTKTCSCVVRDLDQDDDSQISGDLSQRLRASDIDIREYRMFQSLDVQGTGQIRISMLLEAIASAGLSPDDVRLREMMRLLGDRDNSESLWFPEFTEAIRPNILLVEQALQGNLAIPDFPAFTSELTRIYEHVSEFTCGEVAAYIPQLARVNAEQLGVAVCTVDGQQFAIGDSKTDFSVQSCCKPVTYCLALEEHGADYVHQFVGREPSGHLFNELMLSAEGKPHNPMINAGAIMTASLTKADAESGDRFDSLLNCWAALCGGKRVGFNNSVYQSERRTADRNYALGYYMKEHKAFPAETDLIETLEFYFQCCAIEANVEMMSVLAATLANGGVCPVTGERVISTKNVQHCLALMCSCGMYDYSGEFAFEVGLPAKSGVGGAIFVVIPGVLGFCVWSPRLDAHGNSVRGIEFCKEVVRKFSIHNLDSLTQVSDKIDPRDDRIRSTAADVAEMVWAASKGDLGAIHRLIVRGLDANVADYDQRTPLHLAAAEGQEHVVRYFIESGAKINPKDRWGGTPLDDAQRHAHQSVCDLLVQHGGVGRDTIKELIPISSAPAVTSATSDDASPIVELIYAAAEGNLEAIRSRVARGFNLAGADYDLRTPLHLAAAEGHERIVRYLIDQNVDLSPCDRWCNTPLDDAKRHGQVDVVRLLEPIASLDGSDVTAREPVSLFTP